MLVTAGYRRQCRIPLRISPILRLLQQRKTELKLSLLFDVSNRLITSISALEQRVETYANRVGPASALDKRRYGETADRRITFFLVDALNKSANTVRRRLQRTDTHRPTAPSLQPFQVLPPSSPPFPSPLIHSPPSHRKAIHLKCSWKRAKFQLCLSVAQLPKISGKRLHFQSNFRESLGR